MRKGLLHTPEGVRDIYQEECDRKRILEQELHRVHMSFGYHTIQTPMYEFFDVFNREIGSIPAKDMYKFFDREGNTLVLRPDITPSIARAVAMYFGEEKMPIRLCYAGNVFINNNSYQGRLKETTQLGAELIGDDSPEADAEIIAMAVEAMKQAGLSEFQISIGHAGYLKGLMQAAGLNEEQEEEIRELICNKNFFGVEDYIEKTGISAELKELFALLGGFYNSPAQFEQAIRLAKSYEDITYSLQYLTDLHALLCNYEVDSYISYEMGAISDYHYYTGIVFSGYTFGTGETIVKGGRYNKLLKYFGKDAPAIGYVIMTDPLLAALSRQKVDKKPDVEYQLIVYVKSMECQAIAEAKNLRSQGEFVELQCMKAEKTKEDYEAYAARNGIRKVTFMEAE